MAFNLTKIVGNGNAQNVLTNDITTESVIHSFILYNNNNGDAYFTLRANGVDVLTEKVAANSRFSVTDKINIESNTTITLVAPSDTVAVISYYSQVFDSAAATTVIQQMVNDVEADRIEVSDNKDFVASKLTDTNINNISTVVEHMDAIDEAADNALIAQSIANYKGDWSSSTSYGIGESITYTDGLAYISKVADNTSEPVSRTETSEWHYILNGILDDSVVSTESTWSSSKVRDQLQQANGLAVAMAAALG